jgi:ribosome biogenesis GTPase
MQLSDLTPVVGDRVVLSYREDGDGALESVYPRKNSLRRPQVANVDQMLVMGALAEPAPNLLLIDRLLVTADFLGLDALLGFNKADLDSSDAAAGLRTIYRPAGYPLFTFSIRQEQGLEGLLQQLQGKVTVLAGQSGVGKSSLINWLAGEKTAETGRVSRKGGTGRHTTRHVELLPLPGLKDSYIVDTPGFSRLELPEELEAVHLDQFFPEMRMRTGCRFAPDCAHLAEPGCAVKEAVQLDLIAPERYQSYQALHQELKELERRYY